jgi:hypothetical protein
MRKLLRGTTMYTVVSNPQEFLYGSKCSIMELSYITTDALKLVKKVALPRCRMESLHSHGCAMNIVMTKEMAHWNAPMRLW